MSWSKSALKKTIVKLGIHSELEDLEEIEDSGPIDSDRPGWDDDGPGPNPLQEIDYLDEECEQGNQQACNTLNDILEELIDARKERGGRMQSIEEVVDIVIIDDVLDCANGDEDACTSFQDLIDELYPDCYNGSDLACEIGEDSIGTYWDILNDYCEQGSQEAGDYLDEVGDALDQQCQQGDEFSCDLLDLLYDVAGYQTCEQLYDFVWTPVSVKILVS